MADSPILPGQRAWVDSTGKPLPVEFFRFLRDLIAYLRQIDGNTADLTALEARIQALEDGQSGEVIGQMSVSTTQQGEDTIARLVGDILYPLAKSYYGTDESGARGWYQRLLSTLADVDFSTPPAIGDVLKFDGAYWFPDQSAAAQLFNYITTTGEPYCTEDYADLYVGEL